jgi:hypothetical protein
VIRERTARAAFALACFIAIAGILGCPRPGPSPVIKPTSSDAAPATCLDVCRNGVVLGCAFAADTPAGATCVAVCLSYQAVGIAPWDLNCRASATSCAAIDACP